MANYKPYRFHDWVVLGPGPVYPDPLEAASSDLHFHPVLDPSIARPAGGPWYSNEVEWIVAPSYTDGILVRVAPVGHPGRAVLAPNLTDKLYLGPPPQPLTSSRPTPW